MICIIQLSYSFIENIDYIFLPNRLLFIYFYYIDYYINYHPRRTARKMY